MGWDGANGFAFYHLRVLSTAGWRTWEIRVGVAVDDSRLLHNGTFRPMKPLRFQLSVVNDRLSLTIEGNSQIIDRLRLRGYQEGAVVLGTYPTVYGPSDVSLHALRIRAR